METYGYKLNVLCSNFTDLKNQLNDLSEVFKESLVEDPMLPFGISGTDEFPEFSRTIKTQNIFKWTTSLTLTCVSKSKSPELRLKTWQKQRKK